LGLVSKERRGFSALHGKLVDKRHTLSYDCCMKHYSWSIEKNRRLQVERNVSFEEVVFYIERGQLLGIVEHLNQEKYGRLCIFIVEIRDYAYLVPFVETKHEILKTIIPSRKAARMYLRGDRDGED
jgi:hypothetical protein